MAGGPFDNALSPESENAVQNKVIEAEVKKLDKAISDAVALRATLTEFGMGKICPVSVTDATEDNGLVLGAKEKNASVSGSLGNLISKLDKQISWVNVFKSSGETSVPIGQYKILLLEDRYYGSFVLAKSRNNVFENNAVMVQFVNENELRIRKITLTPAGTTYSLSIIRYAITVNNGSAQIYELDETSSWNITAIYVQ